MSTTDVKADLREIADRLPEDASYEDAMRELYVRMKVALARRAADEGRVVSHDEVRKRFAV